MRDKLPFVAFIFLGVIWGSNFIYMKWATEYISSLQVVFLRVLFGFVPVLLYGIYLKVLKLSHLKHSFHFFVMSLIGTTLYYYCFVKSTSLLLSGVSGALSASIPIFAFILSIIFIKEEYINQRRVIGLTFGFIGVILMSNPFNSQILHANAIGIFYILLGSLIVASSFVYAKIFIVPLKIDSVALVTYQLGFSLLTLFITTDFDNILSITKNSHIFLGTIIGLGFLGTGVAFILYYYIIKKLGAITASSVTYIPPIVALLIGYFLLKEDISLLDMIATFFIFLGVYLLNKPKKSSI